MQSALDKMCGRIGVEWWRIPVPLLVATFCENQLPSQRL